MHNIWVLFTKIIGSRLESRESHRVITLVVYSCIHFPKDTKKHAKDSREGIFESEKLNVTKGRVRKED